MKAFLVNYLNKTEGFTILGLGVPITMIDERLIQSAEKGTPTYLLVNDTRLKTDDLRLKLIGSFPKPANLKGQENLLLFKSKFGIVFNK